MKDSGLLFLSSIRDAEPRDRNTAKKRIATLRADIAERANRLISNGTVSRDKVAVYRDEIFVDFPPSPKLPTDGSIVQRDGTTKPLSQMYPIRQWVDYYKIHKYTAYVMGPSRHIEAIQSASRDVLRERGLIA